MTTFRACPTGATAFRHNPERPVSGLDDGEIRPPRRDARVLSGYTMLGRQVDVIETSRGCTFDCSFCSIIEMRGRNFHTYSFERVLADIRDARDRGARSLFIVDDNITLNVRRFEALCQAIIDAGLNDLDYTVQAMTSAIANHGEPLAPLMREAGFRYVFLGIENILEEDLQFLRADPRTRERENGRNGAMRRSKPSTTCTGTRCIVVGGLIVGNPGDTRESIEANLEFASQIRRLALHPAPHALPGHADDQRFSGPRADHQRALGGIRRHHRGRQDRTSLGGGGGVPSVAGGALDEAASHAGGFVSQSLVYAAQWAKDFGPYLSRRHHQVLARSRKRKKGFRALPRDP